MSKTLMDQSANKLNVIGKLLDCSFRGGKMKDGRPYESANFTVRVTQEYNGRTETSEIPASLFSTTVTSSGQPHPGYRSLMQLKSMNSIQAVGETAASRIKFSAGTLRENNFVTRAGQIMNGWQIAVPFLGEAPQGSNEIASFNEDIFIMDMHDEMDREGDTTGRLIVKGGLVQYGGTLDVVEFIVEGNDAIDYISRNWNPNDTVNIGGRIRVTSKEIKRSAESKSWGEELPETATQLVRELIITRGSDEPFDEDFAYDPVEIKKGFNARKARLEQMQINASTKNAPANENNANVNKYSWE